MKPFRNSSSDLADGGVLAARAAQDGYLFFPGLLPGAEITTVRWAVLSLPRVLLRYIFPNREAHTTPQHQDYPHVQSSSKVFAVWIPLGDCTGDMGRLKIAAGSHRPGAALGRR